MRAPSPRSGLTTADSPGCSAAGVLEMNVQLASNTVLRTPPDQPSPSADASPASLGFSFENVWSVKQPLVTALETRSDWRPNAAGMPVNAEVAAILWSY